MTTKKVEIPSDAERILDRLRQHPNSTNILEFLDDVLDDERDDFYQALARWMWELFPDKQLLALNKDEDALHELAASDTLKLLVADHFEDLEARINDDKYAIEVLGLNEKIIASVKEQDEAPPEADKTLADVLQLYNAGDIDVRWWISQIQLNNPKALLPRK